MLYWVPTRLYWRWSMSAQVSPSLFKPLCDKTQFIFLITKKNSNKKFSTVANCHFRDRNARNVPPLVDTSQLVIIIQHVQFIYIASERANVPCVCRTRQQQQSVYFQRLCAACIPHRARRLEIYIWKKCIAPLHTHTHHTRRGLLPSATQPRDFIYI